MKTQENVISARFFGFASSRSRGRRLGRLGRSLAVIATGATLATSAFGFPDDSIPNDQSSLQPIVNSGGTELNFDWPMISIGTAEYKEGPTGVTVFRFGRKVTAAYDVRGEPGTANAEWLRLGRDKPIVDAVVLSGGSLYGLESTTAVMSALKDDQLRTATWNDVAYATGAIIYDMGDRRLNEIYPDKKLAQAAFRAAKPGVFRVGSAGAGRFAKTGYFFGLNAHSGQGGAYYEKGNLKIACFTVVNALGVVTDREGHIKAGYRDSAWPTNIVTTADLWAAVRKNWTSGPAETKPTQNTTISLVVVNQKLSFGDLQRLAIQVHTSMSRGLQPYATEWDGDVLFAVTTGEVDLPQDEKERNKSIALIPAIASEVMWDAILSSVPEQPKQPKPVSVTTPLPDNYAGKYKFSRFVTVEITAKDGKLFAQATGERDAYAIGREKPVALVPVSASLDQFTIDPPSRYPLTLDFSTGTLVINPGLWAQYGTKL
ncbi:MAG: P1 family peptidase [Limisphaerales bacterium]